MDEKTRAIFSENLRKYMRMNDKTQADLRRHMGVSSSTASDWCNGVKIPRADKLQAIADWLGIELSVLVGQKPEDDGSYYLDPETRELVEFLKKNPEHKVLLDSVMDVKPEDIAFIKEMIDRANR